MSRTRPIKRPRSDSNSASSSSAAATTFSAPATTPQFLQPDTTLSLTLDYLNLLPARTQSRLLLAASLSNPDIHAAVSHEITRLTARGDHDFTPQADAAHHEIHTRYAGASMETLHHVAPDVWNSVEEIVEDEIVARVVAGRASYSTAKSALLALWRVAESCASAELSFVGEECKFGDVWDCIGGGMRCIVSAMTEGEKEKFWEEIGGRQGWEERVKRLEKGLGFGVGWEGMWEGGDQWAAGDGGDMLN